MVILSPAELFFLRYHYPDFFFVGGRAEAVGIGESCTWMCCQVINLPCICFAVGYDVCNAMFLILRVLPGPDDFLIGA